MKRTLIEILQSLQLNPTDKGSYILINCPSCGKKEMFIYKSSRKMICNRRNKCGAEINLKDFLQKNKELIIDEIKEEVIENKKELIIPEGIRFFSEENKGFIRDEAFNYLIKRGISKKNILKLGYIFEPGSLYNKTIFFPFWEKNSLVYFTTRDFTENRFFVKNGEKVKIRYLAAKGLDSHEYVYNIDEIKEEEDLFIFEGLMDSLTLEEQTSTAMMTSTIGDKQVMKIWDKAPGRIILVPDNDLAGKKSLIRNYQKILYHRPPSLNDREVLYYELPKEFKDLNASGIKKIPEDKIKQIKKGVIIMTPSSNLFSNY